MVKLNLNGGTNNIDMEGKAVIAIVIDPVTTDGANCAALMIGDTSPHAAMVAAGSGIGSIINQLGRDPFTKVKLFMLVMERAKNAVKGGIEERTIMSEIKEVEEEEEIFNGKMEDFTDGAI